MTVFLTPDGRAVLRRHVLPAAAAARAALVRQRARGDRQAWTRAARRGARQRASASARQLAERRSAPRRRAAPDGRRPGAAVRTLARERVRPPARGLRRSARSSRRRWCWRPCCGTQRPEMTSCVAAAMAGRTLRRRWPAAASTTSSAGGFARYSVDAAWVVPHFEKMLYDNALLLGVYPHWWRLTGEPLAERVVPRRSTGCCRAAHSRRAASPPASTPTPTGHREGAFYVWTPAQLVEVLGADDGAWAAESAGRHRRPAPSSTGRRRCSCTRPDPDDGERLGAGASRLLRRARASGPGRPRRQGRRGLERLADRRPGPGGALLRPAGLAEAAAAARRAADLRVHVTATAGCAGPPATASPAHRAASWRTTAALAEALRPAGRGDGRARLDRPGRRGCSRGCWPQFARRRRGLLRHGAADAERALHPAAGPDRQRDAVRASRLPPARC